MTGEKPLFLSARSWFGEPSDISARLHSLAASHASFVDLTCSNPTRVGFSLPDWGSLLTPHAAKPYAPEPRGRPSARAALAQSVAGRARIVPEDILLTSSTSEAYSYLFQALCDPGDALLVPQPGYPLFEHLAKLAGVRLIAYRLRYDGAWYVDLSSLPTPDNAREQRIRAVLCVSPNNPTGNVLGPEELASLTSLGLPLICDEVFRPYLRKPPPNAADPLKQLDPAHLVITLDGLSKRCAAPGLKLGWMIARGPGASELLERVDSIADTFLSVGAPVQEALPDILRHEPEIKAQIQERIAQNWALLERVTRGTSLTLLEATGGWSALLHAPAVLPEEDYFRALATAGVWVQPGGLYDLPFSNSVVLSLISRPDTFEDGVFRLLRTTTALL